MDESIKLEIEKICKKFFNNEYKSYILSKQSDIQKNNNLVDIKDLIFYYVNYIWHTTYEIDTYFNDNIDYVLIPNDVSLKIKDMDEFIDIIQYIKYKIPSKKISINLYQSQILSNNLENSNDDISKKETTLTTNQILSNEVKDDKIYNENELKLKKKTELTDICRKNKFRGYSRLNKKKLIIFILNNIKSNGAKDKIFNEKELKLNNMTELKNICRKNKFRGYSRLNKKKLIMFILEYNKSVII